MTEKRELKFRAYLKSSNKMIYDFKRRSEAGWDRSGNYGEKSNTGYAINLDGTILAWDDEQYYPSVYPCANKITWRREEEPIIMQYIGLKDKHGKEIYEGDIVSAEWHMTKPTVVEISLGFFYRLIEYAIADELTIIGNCYEHPHLLKETT